MIRPTGRAVLIFVGGIPLALFVVIYSPSLWVLSFNYAILLLLAAGMDALLAFPPRLLNVKVAVPDGLYIGERDAITATIAGVRWPRTTRFDLMPSNAARSSRRRSSPRRSRAGRTRGLLSRSFHGVGDG